MMTYRKTIHIMAGLALALGIGHLIFGVVMFPEFNLNVVWFQGAGIAMIVTALANFNRPNKILRLQNMLTLTYIIVLVTQLPAPQVWVGVVLFSVLTLFSYQSPQESCVNLTSRP